MKRIAFFFALAAFAASFAASAPKATLGDLGLNAQVVTNVDFSEMSVTESDPVFRSWTNNAPELRLRRAGANSYFDTVIGTNGVTAWRFYPGTGGSGIWSATQFDWWDLLTSESDPTVPSWAKSPTPPVTSESDPTVPSWAKAQSKPTYTASEVGAAPASITNDVAEIRVESALVYRLYSGSNVVAEVTNYNSTVHAPELRLMQLNESNEYVTVWTETNGLARTLAGARQYTDDATSAVVRAVAPRAWSKTTSGLGADVPDGETWITTPKVYVTGGLEYYQKIDNYGAVWVLCSNGMTPAYSPDTNAFFRISADDGTPIFSIEKTDAMVVGADADGITVGANSVTIPVSVVSTDPPTMYWRQSLESGSWADESTPPTGATVVWSGEAGARVCTITWSGTRPASMFFRFTFVMEGSTVIRNNAKTDLSAGITINGTNYVPTVSGNNLIWTKQ